MKELIIIAITLIVWAVVEFSLANFWPDETGLNQSEKVKLEKGMRIASLIKKLAIGDVILFGITSSSLFGGVIFIISVIIILLPKKIIRWGIIDALLVK